MITDRPIVLLSSLLTTLALWSGCKHPCPDPPPAVVEETVEIEQAPQPSRTIPTTGTRVVMLGTGTPNPDPERSGPSVAIVSGGRGYIVDCGPGVVRRAAAASDLGIPELDPEFLDRLFVTHLHSDHTAGYPDLILTSWVMGRKQPLEVYGPPGIAHMTTHILEAYTEDLHVRLHGNQPSVQEGFHVTPHEVDPGAFFDDGIVKVTAIGVSHGQWEHAYGYRFEAEDRTIVVSGDTVATDAIVEACDGCDVLVHEVYSQSGFDAREPEWQEYHEISHTSSLQLGELATKARPKLLVLYHQLFWGATEQDLVAEVASTYDGKVVSAHDLDVF